MIKFAIILSLAVSNARASDNGKYYTCDTSILESDNQCIFDLTGEHKGKVKKEKNKKIAWMRSLHLQ